MRRPIEWVTLGAMLVLVVSTGIVLSTVDGPMRAAAQTGTVLATSPANAAGTLKPAPVTVPKTTLTTRRVATTTPVRVVPVAPVVRPTTYAPAPTTTAATTTTTTTTTTIAAIGDQFRPGPVTLPLKTQASNGHVDPVLAWLCAIGFGLGFLLMGARLFVTRSRGRDRAPLS